jgi:hypothetical protein
MRLDLKDAGILTQVFAHRHASQSAADTPTHFSVKAQFCLAGGAAAGVLAGAASAFFARGRADAVV